MFCESNKHLQQKQTKTTKNNYSYLLFCSCYRLLLFFLSNRCCCFLMFVSEFEAETCQTILNHAYNPRQHHWKSLGELNLAEASRLESAPCQTSVPFRNIYIYNIRISLLKQKWHLFSTPCCFKVFQVSNRTTLYKFYSLKPHVPINIAIFVGGSFPIFVAPCQCRWFRGRLQLVS